MGYFKLDEFYCKCGKCEPHTPSPTILFMLNEARSLAGIPFIISSGLRCPQHNRAVGGTLDSEHISGEGVDIAVSSAWERFKILEALMKAGFQRIGVGKTFIHAGVSVNKPRPVIWTYP
jgi:zinc D-Ala-D-Ala carboxypeptidase